MGFDETARLEVVKRYALQTVSSDAAFNKVVELAAHLLSVPIALISIVDKDRIWFKGRHGLDVPQIERELGFCASAILQDQPWVVTNAQTDRRARANKLVSGEFRWRFYAGIPLALRSGHNLERSAWSITSRGRSVPTKQPCCNVWRLLPSRCSNSLTSRRGGKLPSNMLTI
jgi:GAF domain-containing protein